MGLTSYFLAGSWHGFCKKCGEELDENDKKSNCLMLCRSCYNGSDNHIIHRESKYGQ